MDEQSGSHSIQFGDQLRSDVHIRLKNNKGKQELFSLHSSILKNGSKFFADKLSDQSPNSCLEIQCTELDYDHYVKLLKCLYLPTNSLLDSWDSVRSALGVLEVAKTLRCESIFQSCVEYLEAVPWEDSEEDEIIRVVSKLGPTAMPILARIQPVELGPTKNVFLSAIRFATSLDSPFPPFGDELRTSAQEQVEYMLGDDENMSLVTSDIEVKSETLIGLSKTFSFFETELSSILDSDDSLNVSGSKTLQSLSDLEWMCRISLKMGLMTDFVSKWIDISENLLRIIEDKKMENTMWDLKLKLIEVTSKVLDAVGYGNVVIPSPQRVQLLKSWLPFIRKLKPVLDLMVKEDKEFLYQMDDDLCQSIEGAIVSLVLALPSDDQAEILADWMNQQVRYPDLSEAFELWCFRTKSAKRRLLGGLDKLDNPTSLSL